MLFNYKLTLLVWERAPRIVCTWTNTLTHSNATQHPARIGNRVRCVYFACASIVEGLSVCLESQFARHANRISSDTTLNKYAKLSHLLRCKTVVPDLMLAHTHNSERDNGDKCPCVRQLPRSWHPKRNCVMQNTPGTVLKKWYVRMINCSHFADYDVCECVRRARIVRVNVINTRFSRRTLHMYYYYKPWTIARTHTHYIWIKISISSSASLASLSPSSSS